MTSRLSFRAFLREVRFAYIAGISLLIFFLTFGIFEITSLTLYERLTEVQLRTLHWSRGMLTVIVLLGWIAWTLYEYRDRYIRVVREQDDHYRRILNSSRDAVVMTDGTGRISYVNPAAEELFGLAADRMQGGSTMGGTLAAGSPDLDDLFPGGILPALGADPSSMVEWTDRDGRRRMLSATTTELRHASGDVESRMIMIRDITARSIELARMERSERLASLGHMAAGVAHEIGNPLTAISSMVQLLQRRSDDPAQVEQLGAIRDNIRRINGIVKDLVDFSRPKADSMEHVALDKVILDVIGLLKHDARCRHIRFETEGLAPCGTIRAVPDKIFQIITNLMLNAVDAIGEERDPMIVLATESGGGMLAARISDNGRGIPPELSQRIFEPFFTTKEVGKGTGLGLYVSHQLVVQFGGTITVESRPGQTTFHLTFPASP